MTSASMARYENMAALTNRLQQAWAGTNVQLRWQGTSKAVAHLFQSKCFDSPAQHALDVCTRITDLIKLPKWLQRKLQGHPPQSMWQATASPPAVRALALSSIINPVRHEDTNRPGSG